MKNILYTFLVFGLFFSCNDKENDLTEANLNGKVKSVKKRVYDATEKFGGTVKVNFLYEKIFVFNKSGNKIEEKNYDKDGELSYKWKFKYDEDENVIEQNQYNKDGKLILKGKYKNDENGKIIEVNFYNPKSELESTWKYEYDKDENLIKVNFDQDGSNQYVYVYDENENLIEIKDSEDWFRWRFKYDKNGNKTVENAYYDNFNGEIKFPILDYKKEYKYEKLDDENNWLKLITYKNGKIIYITENEIEYFSNRLMVKSKEQSSELLKVKEIVNEKNNTKIDWSPLALDEELIEDFKIPPPPPPTPTQFLPQPPGYEEYDFIQEEYFEVVEMEEGIEVPFAVIENVPIFPGCDKGNNAAKKKCMSQEITKFVQRKFNTGFAGDLGLSGRQRISVIFKIDKSGSVFGVRARAPHPRLEKEATRVINLLPDMKPGKQRGEAVIVSYSLPIIFQVQEAEPESREKDIPMIYDCNKFKTGSFKSVINIGGVEYTSVFKRNDSIQVETFNNEIDSSYVRWINDCEVVFTTINPKNLVQKKPVLVKILRTFKNSYDFEYSYLGETTKRKGKATMEL
jgi:protein TonB